MKGITTLAALPSGSGQAAHLPAENTFTLYPSVPKPLDVQIPEPPNWLMRAIVERAVAHPLKEWLQSDDAQKAIAALKVPAVGKSSVECRATITPITPVAPAIAVGPRHTPDDGRNARDVYVDGVKTPMVLEADTEEGWAIVLRDARLGEFSPGGVRETLYGKVEVFPAGTKGD